MMVLLAGIAPSRGDAPSSGNAPRIRFYSHASEALPAEPVTVGTAGCVDTAGRSLGFTVPLDPTGQRETYHTNLQHAPATLDPAEVIADIGRAFSSINNQFNDCLRPDSSTFEFRRGGTTPDPFPSLLDFKRMDGVNSVTFYPWPNANELAYTFWAVEESAAGLDKVVEWDILINADLAFGTVGHPATYDLWDTVTHEVGHVIGLAHPSNSCSGHQNEIHKYLTMFCSWPGNLTHRTLGLGDMLKLEAIVAERPTV